MSAVRMMGVRLRDICMTTDRRPQGCVLVFLYTWSTVERTSGDCRLSVLPYPLHATLLVSVAQYPLRHLRTSGSRYMISTRPMKRNVITLWAKQDTFIPKILPGTHRQRQSFNVTSAPRAARSVCYTKHGRQTECEFCIQEFQIL